MSAKEKKNNTISQALMDMDSVTSAIREESRKSLNLLLTEAVKRYLQEKCENEEDEEETKDSDYEIVEPEKQESTAGDNEDIDNAGDSGEVSADGSAENSDSAEEPAPEQEPEKADGEDGWDEFSEYNVGGDGSYEYDLTGVKDGKTLAKVYKLLKDDDGVVITQKGDTLKLRDGANDAEYVIDLGTDGEDGSAQYEGAETGSVNESDIAGIDNDEVNNGGGADVDARLDKLEDTMEEILQRISAQNGSPAASDVNESQEQDGMNDNDEMLFEVDLGYTDSYQKKDPIKGLSNSEPSATATSTIDAGVPKGTEKPWAGKTEKKGEPFAEPIKEEEIPDLGIADGADGTSVEEQRNVGGFVQQNSVTASNIPNSSGRKARNAHKEGAQVSSTSDNRSAVAEAFRRLKKENKELKEAIVLIRKNLTEAYVTNMNLGKITKLFLENATTQAEKADIVDRFANEATTVEKSNALYESIKRELSKTHPKLDINESKTAKGTKEMNEEKVYKSPDLLKSIDLMNRMLEC